LRSTVVITENPNQRQASKNWIFCGATIEWLRLIGVGAEPAVQLSRPSGSREPGPCQQVNLPCAGSKHCC
jgi:hypothetical protein